MSNINFTDAEAALISTIITDLSQFTSYNIKSADFDSVFLFACENSDVYYLAWTEYAGGTNQGRGIWQHNVTLFIGILFRGDETTDALPLIESDLRTIVDAMYAEMIPENNLGGAVLSSTIESVDPPFVMDYTDPSVSLMLIAFNIIIDESIARC
ncbi:MAG: hypothetical protein ACW98Y_15105 [Candidatus Thorarchaeota archaeon]|jgi:hypothetical protein